MSKKIGLYIGGRRFDADVDDEFGQYLENNMTKDFNIEGNNDLKTLVQAYVRKNHELYMQEKEIAKILKKLDEKDKF
jgi:hypothetical protein